MEPQKAPHRNSDSEQNKVGGTMLRNIKLYHKVPVIKTGIKLPFYGTGIKADIYQWNRIESPEINPYL